MTHGFAGSGRRGAVLIICVAILTVLALLAVSFARLMTLEETASANYVDMVRARFIAHSGVERAIEELRRAASGRSWDDPALDAWIYQDTLPLEETMDPSFKTGVTPSGDAYSGVLGDGMDGPYRHNAGYYEEYGDYYKLQIVDAGAQINLNGPQRNLPGILENLGKALQAIAQTDPNYGRINPRRINPIPSQGVEIAPNIPSTGRGMGLTIVQARDKLPMRKFSSKEELLPIVGPEAFRILRDFVTVHSYTDEDTAAGNLDLLDLADATRVAISYGREFRAPINLNTAPRPVLEAVLSGLTARVPVVSSEVETATPTGFSFLEEVELKASAQWMEIPPITPGQARRIVDLIVARRKTDPFQTWEEFNRFVDSIPDNAAFLPPSTAAPAHVQSKSDPAAWWYRRAKDMIKANANPNLRRNKFNPDVAAALTLDKGDLWRHAPGHPAAVGHPNGMIPSHTTEFSFSSMGWFEITSLGRVTRGGGEIVGEAKLRVVVRVYSVLRHTTQKQFEDPVFVGTTKLNPKFSLVSSYPEFVRAKLGFTGNGSELDGFLAQEPRDSSVANPAGFSVYGMMRAHFDENLGQVKRDKFLSQLDGQTPGAKWPAELLAGTGEWEPLLGPDRRASEDFKWFSTKGNNVSREGFFSTAFVERLNRYLFYPAQAKMGQYFVQGGNAPLYRGACEFFVKLQHDADEDVHCGLGSATLVTRQTNGVNSGGVQWFFFKDTMGRLRITRLYFERAFDESGTADQGLAKVDQADRSGIIDASDPKSGYRYKVARTDMLVDVRDWRAHEWHHLAIAWDDELPDRAKLRVWIDAQERSSLPEVLPNLPNPLDRYPSFVILNARNPKNVLFVGGFVRRQLRRDGVFKHSQIVEDPANATLDTFNLFHNPLAFSVLVPPSRYDTTGFYEHAFAPNLPRDVPVGSISWTVYRPVRNPYRNDAGAFKYSDGNRPVVDLVTDIETPQGVKKKTFVFAQTGGAGDKAGEVLKAGGTVKYRLNFRHNPGVVPRLASPVVDDVTVILLTEPRIMSWEWVL